MDTRKLTPGFSEMTLVHLTASRVMKSRSIQLVCTTDIATGLPKLDGTPTILKPSEEDSRSSRDHAKVSLTDISDDFLGCHGAIHGKYDLLVDKGFAQRELMDKMVYSAKLHPASQKYKGDFFQEWDFRQRVIYDRMWSPYFTVHQTKQATKVCGLPICLR